MMFNREDVHFRVFGPHFEFCPFLEKVMNLSTKSKVYGIIWYELDKSATISNYSYTLERIYFSLCIRCLVTSFFQAPQDRLAITNPLRKCIHWWNRRRDRD